MSKCNQRQTLLSPCASSMELLGICLVRRTESNISSLNSVSCFWNKALGNLLIFPRKLSPTANVQVIRELFYMSLHRSENDPQKRAAPSFYESTVCSNSHKIFTVLKIKYLNIASEGTAVSLNQKSSLFTDCILYLLGNDTKWQ